MTARVELLVERMQPAWENCNVLHDVTILVSLFDLSTFKFVAVAAS